MKSIQQNQTAEWSFKSGKTRKDPFSELELSVRFRHADGEEKQVPAFWAGGKNWRVRFASPRMGPWHFQTVCSDPSDAGLHGQKGDFKVTPYKGNNPLYRHGPIRIGADQRHFEHADGTPFFWLGDTWWMGLTKRLNWPQGFHTLAADRVKKGFTVVQIVAGLYPDMPAFDPRGANEAGFPWEKDYKRINPSYFDRADRRIKHLVESGLVPCIVGCWGYFLPWTGVENMKKHWRNLVARYGSYPVLWCLAGEVTMAYYLSPNRLADRDFQRKGWNELAVYLRQIDPYRRPITAHPGSSARKELAPDQHVLGKTSRVLAAISEGWRFKTDPDDCGEAQGWYRATRDSSWKSIRVNASWTDQGYDYHGAAWYDVECAIPPDVKNAVHLLFHAVDGTAKVWVDGNFAGEQARSANVMWNLPWSLDISQHVASKKTVRITVKVVKEQYASGIYSPVELREERERRKAADVPSPSVSKTEPCYEMVKEIDGDVLDFDMLQTGHGDRSSLPNTVNWVRQARQVAPPMPVVEGEVCYEGIGEFCRQEVQRWLFWACILGGAAGFTYGANGIWQVNTRKKPYGPSPHGMTWGNTPWEDAHRLPGSEHVGLAKRFLTRFPWWQLEPHPEWVEPHWTPELCDLPFTSGRHDIPLAAGIPGRLRVIYVPLGAGLRMVRDLEKGVRYRARIMNPATGAERDMGPIQPEADGSWKPSFPGMATWFPFPIFQDWVLALEAKGT